MVNNKNTNAKSVLTVHTHSSTIESHKYPIVARVLGSNQLLSPVA